MQKFNPHKYQDFAINMIKEKSHCGLFLDMGMGKTVSTLTAIRDLMYDDFSIRRVLVVAPLKVSRDVWPKEVDKWEHTAGLKVARVLGSAKQRKAALRERADVYVINLENLAWLCDGYRMRWPFDMVILDESSAFKDHKSQRFKMLVKTLPFSSRVVELSGTPTSTGLLDLWAQVYLLDGGQRLGRTFAEYQDRYFKPGEWVTNDPRQRKWEPREGAKEKIMGKIGDVCVSMLATDWLDMPEYLPNTVTVSLSKAERDTYRKMEREMLLPYADGDGDIEALTASALTMKLLQLANGAAYDENGNVRLIHDRKLDALGEIIGAMGRRPVMVLYWFRHDRDRIRARFPQARDLKTSEDEDQWNAGEIPLLLVHPQSAGHGLNLQYGGNTAVWFGLTWSYEKYYQTCCRLYRQGQKEATVIIHHLVTEGTMDEAVMQSLGHKGEIAGFVMRSLKARIRAVRDGR